MVHLAWNGLIRKLRSTCRSSAMMVLGLKDPHLPSHYSEGVTILWPPDAVLLQSVATGCCLASVSARFSSWEFLYVAGNTASGRGGRAQVHSHPRGSCRRSAHSVSTSALFLKCARNMQLQLRKVARVVAQLVGESFELLQKVVNASNYAPAFGRVKCAPQTTQLVSHQVRNVHAAGSLRSIRLQ